MVSRPRKNQESAPTLSLDDLHELVSPIFQQAQFSLANHKKNIVSLHKIHSQSSQITETLPRGKGVQLVGEAAFNKVFMDMLNRVLPLKKGVTQADKIVKFVSSFVKYTAEKAAEGKGEDEEDEDTPASRFVTFLIKHLLRGFQAKDKVVRFRVVHIVAEMISSIGEIDEDLFTTLRVALLERVRDKESPVRVQAVIAIAKLQEGEDPTELDEDEQSLTEVLVEVLQYDPSPDVRRAALLNITASKLTLAAILSRTRDQDTMIRKILYGHVLSALPHPKLLSIEQREGIVKNGLKDREPAVRATAGRLVGGWVDLLGGELEELLKLFDLIGSEDVAQEALFSVFVTRPDIFDNAQFNDEFWNSLTPEKAFLARVFVDHCIATKDNSRLESSLPVVTALAFRIQHEYNALLELLRQLQKEQEQDDDDDVEDADVAREEKKAEKQHVIAQLLKLAVNLDYADEIGRRKMYGLVREMISQEVLPEELVARCLDVLRKLSSSERDLIRLVVEVVQELRDLTREDDPEQPERAPEDETQFGDDRTEIGARAPGPQRELSPESQARAESIDLRCLALCIGMLERVNSTLQDNSVFHGLLPELIIPAVRSKEPLTRERGLVCLGLCCLIDKKVALSSFPLFVQQVQVAAEDLKKKVLETVFDLLMVYESEFFKPDNKTEELLVQLLDQDSPEVQAIACEGVAKLMLSGMVKDEKLLRNLVILYLIPETEDNQPLRQCLSYFFPVYCYSSPLNQQRMRKVFLHTYDLLQRHRADLDSEQTMIPASQVALLFVDWTDPEKAVEVKEQMVDTTVHVELAVDVMKTLLKQKLNKEDKKILCQLLPKLHVPDDLEQDKAKLVKVLASTLHKRRPPNDTVARNAVAKFDKSLDKKLATQLEGFTQANYLELKQLQELFDDADDIINGGDDDDAESINVDDDDRVEKTPPAHGQARKNARTRDGKATKKQKGQGMEEVDKDIDNMLDSGAEEASVAPSQADEESDLEVESVLGEGDDDETE